MSASHADDDEEYYGLDADGYPLYYVDCGGVQGAGGLNNHYIIAAPEAYIYTWGQLEDVSYSIGRDATDRDYMGKDAYVTMTGFTVTPADSALDGVVTAPEFPRLKTTFGGYIGEKELFDVTVPQIADPENPGKTINADIADYAGDYAANLTLYFTESGDNFGDATYTVTRNLHIYNDYGLNTLVRDALRANRQLANYAAGSTAEWNAYLTALTNAEAIILKPKTAATFDRSVYEGAATALKDAIEALDARAEGAGVEALIEARELVDPSNEDDANYYDAGYHFFGSQDYVLYTFERYRTHRNNMNDLIDSQNVSVPEPGDPEDYETPEKYEEAVAAYEKALANIPTLSLFEITYRKHMYEMNAARMIRTVASKNYLNIAYNTISEAILSLDESAYTVKSWEALTHAIDFAETVIADNSADLRQTKVNRARHELIEAYKGLTIRDTTPADYTQLDAAIEAANRIYETEGYESLYTGLEALEEAYNAALAISRDLYRDEQAVIDAAAAALNAALDAITVLEGLQIETNEDILAEVGYGDPDEGAFGWRPAISEFANAFDEDTGEALSFLSGLVYEQDPSFLESVIAGEGNFEYVCNEERNVSGMIATGDKIVGSDGTEVYIIIYGDCNGDGAIDISDVSELVAMMDWALDDDCMYGGIFTTAADVFADQDLTIEDYSYLIYLLEFALDVDIWSFPQDGTFVG